MNIIGIIPARYGSTRFPGKPLVKIGGVSMIERVYKQAQKAKMLNNVLVATDDKRIFEHVKQFNGNVVLTSTEHPSGTDRCLEALLKFHGDYDAVVNIQGDEPFIEPSVIDELCVGLQESSLKSIVTLVTKITEVEKLSSQNVVKAIIAANNKALYFSRAAIPFNKTAPINDWLKYNNYYHHIGVYAYPVNILKQICELKPSNLENIESLEQLRWLENGFNIQVKTVNEIAQAVDTPEDLEKINQHYKLNYE